MLKKPSLVAARHGQASKPIACTKAEMKTKVTKVTKEHSQRSIASSIPTRSGCSVSSTKAEKKRAMSC